MSRSKKKPYVMLSAEQKQEICQRKAENPQLSNLELAIVYCTGKTAIQNIIARSEKWINIDINEPYVKRLRNRRPRWKRPLLLWMSTVTENGDVLPVTPYSLNLATMRNV